RSYPSASAAAGTGQQMIEREVIVGTAILAGKPVAQKHVEPSEGRIGRWFHKCLERNDAGQQHLEARAAHRLLVIGHDVNSVQEYRLDCVLPAPQRQWIVAQRAKIRVEHQGRPTVMSRMSVHGTLLHLVPTARTGNAIHDTD